MVPTNDFNSSTLEIANGVISLKWSSLARVDLEDICNEWLEGNFDDDVAFAKLEAIMSAIGMRSDVQTVPMQQALKELESMQKIILHSIGISGNRPTSIDTRLEAVQLYSRGVLGR